ncbi:MAG TPA: alpha/beta hydrolase [Thermoanaerobaculia bacterium]|jgi:pimeloyl-ACP methyl ester carboxylesterase|nr:alpha/beta hydrolase [Thermoanaerobaculia bacterium]
MTDRPILTHRLSGLETGPPVLLLNGGMMSIAGWEPIAQRLEPDYRVVRCDFRGQTLTPGEEARLEGHVADVIALLDSLGLERVHIAGTSFGGIIGLLLAARHPERILSLAAMTTTERITPKMWQGTLRLREAALAGASGGDGGVLLDLLLPGTYSAAYLEAQRDALTFHRRWVASLPLVWFRGTAAILSSLENLDLTPDLPRIVCPTLVLAGAADVTFPLEHSRALAAAIPHSRLEIVPDGPHGVVIEQAGRVADILLSFLQSI